MVELLEMDIIEIFNRSYRSADGVREMFANKIGTIAYVVNPVIMDIDESIRFISDIFISDAVSKTYDRITLNIIASPDICTGIYRYYPAWLFHRIESTASFVMPPFHHPVELVDGIYDVVQKVIDGDLAGIDITNFPNLI